MLGVMGVSRRHVLTRLNGRAAVASVAGALGPAVLAACRPGEGVPQLSFGPKAVRIAAFLPQESNMSADRAIVEVQSAAAMAVEEAIKPQ